MPSPLNHDLRVLVVDDTVVYRRILQNVVGEVANATVVGVAANGRIALERLEHLEVDVVLLDVEMPEMNGIETLKEIRQRWPDVGVVLVSGSDRRSADLTVLALSLGALDFVPKADTGDVQRNQQQLVRQVTMVFRGFEVRRHLGQVTRTFNSTAPSAGGGIPPRPNVGAAVLKTVEARLEPLDGRIRSKPPEGMCGALGSGTSNLSAPQRTGDASGKGVSVRPTGGRPIVLLIGCSTGGPQALAKVVPALPGDLGVPVLVVQHMPPVFTASLAESLNRASALTVREASEGQLVEPNVVLIAPGGHHMTVFANRGRGEQRIAITDAPPVNSCRPSVDVLFQSAAIAFGGATLSVVLTGMGEDGLEGVRALRAAGGKTLTQSEESCVVYGMPRAIDLAGYSDESMSIQHVAGGIVRWLRMGSSRRDASG